VVAPSRSKRPFNVSPAPQPGLPAPPQAAQRPCPFCPGNEERPLEIDAWPGGGSEVWRVRIVRNLFPALVRPDVAAVVPAPARGFHEVVVISRLHEACTALLRPEEIADVLRRVNERCKAIASQCRCIAVFENHGKLAGASLPHPHWQILALLDQAPLPPKFDEMLMRASADQQCPCSLCNELASELGHHHQQQHHNSRIVIETEHFVAWVPYAAESPYETWIAPRRHSAPFFVMSDAEIVDFASVLQRLLLAIYTEFNNPDYNMAVVDPPLRLPPALQARLHWYAIINVRLTQPAGFELATGMAINPQAPEISANILRNALSNAPH